MMSGRNPLSSVRLPENGFVSQGQKSVAPIFSEDDGIRKCMMLSCSFRNRAPYLSSIAPKSTASYFRNRQDEGLQNSRFNLRQIKGLIFEGMRAIALELDLPIGYEEVADGTAATAKCHRWIKCRRG
jgi:hypothetical protein